MSNKKPTIETLEPLIVLSGSSMCSFEPPTDPCDVQPPEHCNAPSVPSNCSPNVTAEPDLQDCLTQPDVLPPGECSEQSTDSRTAVMEPTEPTHQPTCDTLRNTVTPSETGPSHVGVSTYTPASESTPSDLLHIDASTSSQQEGKIGQSTEALGHSYGRPTESPAFSEPSAVTPEETVAATSPENSGVYPATTPAPTNPAAEPSQGDQDASVFVNTETDSESEEEFRSIDGTGNNILDPEAGAADTELVRLSFNDSTRLSDATLPSAREVSNLVSAQTGSVESARGLSDFTWVWGQFLDHDITFSEEKSGESAPIAVPKGDPFFDPQGTGEGQIDFERTAFQLDDMGQRQQLNEITAFVDASQVYGSDEEVTERLRAHEAGKMAVSAGDFLPVTAGERPGTEQFDAGDARSNENVALTTMHTLFVREHNRLAELIAMSDYAHQDLSDPEVDESIFQRARAMVAAEMQSITYNEFLPALLGENALSAYSGYDPSVDPGIANEFSTAAFRVGHTMLSSELLRLDSNGEVIEQGNLALRDAFFRPDRFLETGVDPILRGLSQQAAQEVDVHIVDDVRNFLFGKPGSGGFDLASLNIQRGRDHELPSYNDVRGAIGLERVDCFEEISSDPDIVQSLKTAYASVDDMDLYVGGLAEDHLPGGSVGETFSAIIVDQFERLRDGDRFWYENTMSASDIAQVESMTLGRIIELNSNATVQEDVFFREANSREQHLA